MKLTTKVDFKTELERIKKEVKQESNQTVEARTEFATDALRRVTPIDTGYARSRWTYTIEKDALGNTVGLIDNDAPYIGRLNQGSSKQAPKYFIEQTLIAIGELRNPVVDYLEE